MKIENEFLLKNSWHDIDGNVLVFSDTGINELGIHIKKSGNLLLCVDSRQCCNGMFEETNGTLKDITNILNSYGYTLLAEEFRKSYFKSDFLEKDDIKNFASNTSVSYIFNDI